MCKCVLVLKITKNLYIVVVMLLCVKIKKKKMTSVKRHLDGECLMWTNHQRQENKSQWCLNNKKKEKSVIN